MTALHTYQSSQPIYQTQPRSPIWRDTYAVAEQYAALFTSPSTDHAQMNPHGLQKDGALLPKYKRRPGQPITTLMIAEHLAGRKTYATQIQARGAGRFIVIDIDDGGAEAVQAALETLASFGIWAFGVLSSSINEDGTEAHTGGHIWIPIDGLASTSELHKAGQGLASELGLAAPEVWPQPGQGVDIRLPFGKNQRSQPGQEWGGLALAGQAPLMLSSGLEGFTVMLESYQPNGLAVILAHMKKAPQPQPKPGRQRQQRPQQTGMAFSDNPIKEYNQRVDIRDVIERNGGKEKSTSLCHCPGQGHKNNDAHASLHIKASTAHGAVASCYSPACQFHHSNLPARNNGAVTAFDMMRMLEHGGDTTAAIRAARRELGMPLPERRPLEMNRIAPAPRPVITNHAAILAAVIAAAASDDTLTRTARRILTMLVQLATGQGWCNPTNQAIQDAAGCSERAVQYGTRQLQARGYLTISYDGNAYGGSASNVYTLLEPQSRGGGAKPLHPINVLKESKAGQSAAIPLLPPANPPGAAAEPTVTDTPADLGPTQDQALARQNDAALDADDQVQAACPALLSLQGDGLLLGDSDTVESWESLFEHPVSVATPLAEIDLALLLNAWEQRAAPKAGFTPVTAQRAKQIARRHQPPASDFVLSPEAEARARRMNAAPDPDMSAPRPGQARANDESLLLPGAKAPPQPGGNHDAVGVCKAPGFDLAGAQAAWDRCQIETWLRSVGLEHLRDLVLDVLIAGERARALVGDSCGQG